MNIYQDENMLWHDRDIKRYGKSNNWQNYTPMAMYLGLPVDVKKFRQYNTLCVSNLNKKNIKILRHPNKINPPMSADCILGLYIMGQIPYELLKSNHFVFHGTGKPVDVDTLKEVLVGVSKLALIASIFQKYDRNLYWEKNVVELYQAAFRLHPGYVYFIKKHHGATIHKEEQKLWDMYVKYTLNKKSKKTGDISQKNLLWLMAMHMGDHGLAKKCKPEVNIPLYFGDDHPFTKRVIELKEKGLL